MNSNSKSIVLTGASSGFGFLVLKHLLARGHRVIATVRGGAGRILHDPDLDRAVKEGSLVVLDVHMERPETFKLIKDAIRLQRNGKLDVLINNAGYGILRPVELQTPDQVRHQFQVNFFAPLELTRLLLPELRKSQGRIINVSSIAGLLSFPFYGIYSATKHALEAASEALRFELKPFGIQVALVEPGGFKTEFTNRSLTLGKSDVVSEEYRSRIENFDRFLSSKREHGGDPKAVANLIVSLCEKRKISLHNIIGRDAQLLRIIRAILPKTIQDWLKDLFFRIQVFRDFRS